MNNNRNETITDNENINNKIKKRKLDDKEIIESSSIIESSNSNVGYNITTNDIIHRIIPTTFDIENDAKDYIEKCSYQFASMISCIAATNLKSNNLLQSNISNTTTIQPQITSDSIIEALSSLGYKDYVSPLRKYCQANNKILNIPTNNSNHIVNTELKQSKVLTNNNKPTIKTPSNLNTNDNMNKSHIKIASNLNTNEIIKDNNQHISINKDNHKNINYAELNDDLRMEIISEFKCVKKSYIRKKSICAKYNVRPSIVKMLYEKYFK